MKSNAEIQQLSMKCLKYEQEADENCLLNFIFSLENSTNSLLRFKINFKHIKIKTQKATQKM